MMKRQNDPEAIKEVCRALSLGEHDAAKTIAKSKAPFKPQKASGRHYTKKDELEVYWRDGFIDRYTSQKLVHPAVLRLLHLELPECFPFQKNWKFTECHFVFWELSPTVDHILPQSRGGTDEIDNWVTASQITNSAKANWTLTELGWQLQKPGNVDEWDGLSTFFISYVNNRANLLQHSFIREWHRVTLAKF